jgi:enterochelin esterase-like enzyme
MKHWILACLGLLFLLAPVASGFEDHTHFSRVFNANKTYRIFFPADYASSATRYPVIYFFHGWGGRYNADPNARYDSTQIDSVVRNSQCVLVAWDGNIELSQPRPYNVGYHNDVVYQMQMKDYFPELVGYIDSTYRTQADRAHRAVMGFSMGGFMSFFLAGKYPHLICGAVNFVGGPEYFVGYPANHTHYPVKYGFGNLLGINLRFHRTSSDQLYFLNTEVHEGALREAGLHYQTQVYPGAHGIDSAGQIVKFNTSYDFLESTFAAPPAEPSRWHHMDLYPNFSAYGCSVNTNLAQPGYIDLHGVTTGGMRVRTQKWLPDGRLIPGVTINIRTADTYQANTAYTVFKYNVTQSASSTATVTSDASGRVSFSVNHEENQVGIYKSGDPAEIVAIGHVVDDTSRFLRQGQTGQVKFTLLNRGGSTATGLVVMVSSSTANVNFAVTPVTAPDLAAGAVVTSTSIDVQASYSGPSTGKPWQVRLNLVITDNQGHTWNDELDVPVWFNVTAFANIAIDDGRAVNGTTLGTGNGNGTAQAGEQVMVHTGTQRLRLYTNDPFVDREAETLYDEVLPSVWPDGYTLSSVVKFKSTCPNNRVINFLASCETKTFDPINRGLRWGTVSVTVTGGPTVTIPDKSVRPLRPGGAPAVLLLNGATAVTIPVLPGAARLSIYNAAGQLQHAQTLSASTKTYPWTSTNTNGQTLAAGLYFYAVTGSAGEQCGKIVVVR